MAEMMTGPAGASITKVKLEKGNKLAVWIDGERRVVGTVDVPAAVQFMGGGTAKSKRVVSSIDNPGEDVLTFATLGQEAFAPLAQADADTVLFEYDATNRKFRPKASGEYGFSILANVDQGAGTPHILYYLAADADPTEDGVATGEGFLQTYDVDGNSSSISFYLDLSSELWYGLRLRNTTNGDAVFTTFTYTTALGDVLARAFIFQLTRVL